MIGALALLVVILGAGSAAGTETLKLATWNIQHLKDRVRERPNKRSAADFERLAGYAQRLDADVIAFQEVENLKAAARVFDPEVYRLFIEHRLWSKTNTGFAVRRSLKVRQNPDFKRLNVGGLRHGTDITLSLGKTELRLLSIHLKAGCYQVALDSGSYACKKLARQLPILEAWIDARAKEGIPFAVLGDFNRRFDAREDEEFWREIDDGEPANADLLDVTRGQSQLCWGGQYRYHVDHLVFGRQSAKWIKPKSFEQIVYTESRAFRTGLSDHCPLAVTLQVR